MFFYAEFIIRKNYLYTFLVRGKHILTIPHQLDEDLPEEVVHISNA